MLFATNMVAILLVGGLTFLLTGVTPIQRVAENQHRVQTAILVTCTAAVLIFAGLLLNGAQITADTLKQSNVESTIDDWLSDDMRYRLIDADLVSAVVVGLSHGVPNVSALADALTVELGKPITVRLSLVVEERFTAIGS